jgi:hypothetical protein
MHDVKNLDERQKDDSVGITCHCLWRRVVKEERWEKVAKVKKMER